MGICCTVMRFPSAAGPSCYNSRHEGMAIFVELLPNMLPQRREQGLLLLGRRWKQMYNKNTGNLRQPSNKRNLQKLWFSCYHGYKTYVFQIFIFDTGKPCLDKDFGVLQHHLHRFSAEK